MIKAKKASILAVVGIMLLATLPVMVSAEDYDDNSEIIRVPEDYPTIQAAIDAANPGATIIVGPGEYAGAVITKTVDIQGDETVINDGPQFGPGLPHSVVMYKVGFFFVFGSGSGSSISGFIFESDIVHQCNVWNLVFPIFSVGTDNIVVRNNVIHNAIFGVINWDGSNWVIEDNDILGSQIFTCPNDYGDVVEDGGIGISIRSVWGGPTNGNLVRNNRIVGAPQAGFATPAIELISQTEGTDPPSLGGAVQNNRIVDNHIAWGGSGVGIYLEDQPGDAVVGNEVADNKVHGCARGIAVLGASDNAFTENSIQDSQEHGIYAGYSYNYLGNILREASDNYFYDNKVKGSGVNGIFMDEGSSNNFIVENKVSGSGEYDLKDLGIDNVWIENEYDTKNW